MPKTSTERVRKHRAKKKTPKPPPKSNQQRSREFRMRRAALKAAGISLIGTQTTTQGSTVEHEECERPLLVVVKEEPRDYYEEEEDYELGEESVEDILQSTEEMRCEEDKQQVKECEQRDEVQLGSETPETKDFVKVECEPSLFVVVKEEPSYYCEEEETFELGEVNAQQENVEDILQDTEERMPIPGTKVILSVKHLKGTIVGEQEAFKEVKYEADDVSSNSAEYQCEEHESSVPENEDMLSPTNRQPCAGVLCSETIWYKKTWKEHEQEHREEPLLFTSSTCQQHFADRTVCHLKAHESEKKTKFSCEICGKEFERLCNLNVHLRTHTVKKLHVCDYCGKEFRHLSRLDEHRRKHTGEQPYSCSICNKRFAYKGSLVTHTRLHTKFPAGEQAATMKMKDGAEDASGSGLDTAVSNCKTK